MERRGTKLHNDAIHGMFEIPAYMLPAIACRIVQRLGRVAQCGNLRLVWVSATHTRLAHSIGTAHLADQYALRLGFRPRLREAFGLAALLHDVGHGPFSHVFEGAIKGTPSADLFVDHDVWRHVLVNNNPELREALGEERKDEVRAIWNDDPGLAPQLWPGEVHVAHALIAGVAGVDRLDYLLRDSQQTSPQHRIDRTAIQAIMLTTTVNFDAGTVTYEPKGEHYVGMLLDARRYMFREVYLHPRAVAADTAMAVAFREGVEERARALIHPERFRLLTDGWIEQQADTDQRIADALDNRAPRLVPAIDPETADVRHMCPGIRASDLVHITNRWDNQPDVHLAYRYE